jgi:membrane protein DedA with SNARE-associated domain
MEQNFQRYLTQMRPLLDRYGYLIVAGAVLADGMGIPTPGQILVIASALEATQGRMNIASVFFIVAAAAALGNTIGYALGRWAGRALLKKLTVNARRQQHLEEIFRRRGAVVILLARFLDGFRQLNGIVAGIMRMSWRTFTIYNIAGALLWTCVWVLGTYYFARDIHAVTTLVHHHGRTLYVITAAALIAVLVWLMPSKKLVKLVRE